VHPDHETLRRVEDLHVRAWPASDTAAIDGWLWRCSGGGSRRANSVSTVRFTGASVDAALDRVEARYRARGAPARLHTFELTEPASLPDRLVARGYGMDDATVTMLATANSGAPPADVEITDQPTADWRAVYLEAVSESRRAVNQEILRRIPDPRAFISVRRDGAVISTALGVAHGGFAVAECVATRADARGQRGAEAAMRGLMVWAASLGAHGIGLQVLEDNAPAVRLYQRLGFRPVATNRFWVRP
jgi:N-acetylglutamate synthase